MVNHALPIRCKQQTCQQCRVFGAMLARALLPPFDESVGGIPEFWRNDRLVLPRITLALVHHLAKVDAVAQHGEQVLLIDWATGAMQTTLCDPGLRGLALDGKFADKLRRRTMLGIAAEDAAHQLGLGGIDDQFALDDVVPEWWHTTHPHAFGLARGNLVADTLARDFALELRERQQDVECEPPHGGGGIELLGDGNERHPVAIEHVDQFGEIRQGPG